ncbi:hypothetical protein [Streptomyces mesophilus]|uniref:hypothetical protein n=1 Tax=Streptomyces mesophilus TaxID=1775132 RepID=UPI0033230320
MTITQITELVARLRALAGKWPEVSDPSLQDASLVFARRSSYRPARGRQIYGEIK